MTHIASPQNPRLKALRRLHGKRERARSGAFVAEGEDLIAAARAPGARALEGYRARRARASAATASTTSSRARARERRPRSARARA